MNKYIPTKMASTALLFILASSVQAQTTPVPPFVALSQKVDALAAQVQNSSGSSAGGTVGGTTGQVLTKKSSTNYDTQWSTLGTAAGVNTGTSGATIGLLNTSNNWSALQTFAPSTALVSSINIPSGISPSTPNSGDFFNTSGILKFYDGSLAHSIAFVDSNITGSSAKLTTPRTITATGDLSWTTSFDGSANVTSTATLATVNPNAGTFGSPSQIPIITVDGKGRITAMSMAAVSSSGSSGSGSSTFVGLSDVSGLSKATSATQFFGITTNSSNAISSLQYTTATSASSGASNAGNLVQLTSGGVLDPTLLPTVNTNVGTIGSSSQVPVLTIDAKGRITAATTATVSSGSGSSGSSADIQVFNYTGNTQTWTKPTGAKVVYIWAISGGAGGAGGYNSTSSGTVSGGLGGAGGGVNDVTIPAAVLPATVTVTVGSGGAGGAGSISNSAGGIGAPGTNSSFTGYLTAFSSASGTFYTPSNNDVYLGGTGSYGDGTYALVAAGAGGGGGSGSSIGNGYSVGAKGGQGAYRRGVTSKAGTGGNSVGAVGTDAVSDIATNETNGGSGGGGGAGSTTVNSTNGGSGGAGSTPGGGGGGGGGGYSVTAGAGGNGAPGRVIVITTF